jgi:hypothetical protein
MSLLGLNTQQLTFRLPVSDLRFALLASLSQKANDNTHSISLSDSHDGAFVNSDYLTDALALSGPLVCDPPTPSEKASPTEAQR